MPIPALSIDPDRATFRRELSSLLHLAGPIVAAEVGWMTMGLVDAVLVGRVGPEALGGVSIGGNLFIAVAIFGMGMLLGLDTLISHAHGGGRTEDAHRSLFHGVYLSLVLSAALMILVFVAVPHLSRLGIDPAVMPHAVPYLKALTWGLPPLLLFVALRRYLQATGHVQPIMIALISANVVNFLAAWALIFGRWGLPSMGAAGAGWATCISRVYLLVFIIAYIVRRECRQGTGLHQSRRRIDPDRMRRLLTLGFPAATQLSLEVGVFALATVLVGRMGAKPLAAHQVALVAISFIFMVPLGISSAGAVRVGQNLGRGRADAAGLAGWTALLCTAGFMALSAGCLSLFPRLILEGFTNDREVIEWGVKLLRVAAVFQLFDGLQVVATGVLRGLGETRTPMIANIVGHWVLGLPVGSWLAFSLGLGVVGLWSGLCLGLITCGLTLLFVWGRRCGRMPAGVLRPISQT